MGATDGDAVVDGYTTLRTLGKGASGTVVLARHDASGSLLVVKQLAPELVAAHGFLERFREQAEILGQLRHPNIVSVYWHVERRAEALVAMEAVNGISLRRLLDHGPTDPESALVVLQGALRGLQYAHGAGAVHGDIAPENVLLDSAGDPRLVDFGLAVPVPGDALAAGRPQYMAPEQWQTGRATRQSDIYAAAAVCFECVAGEPPFTGATLTELRQLHLAAWVPVEQLPEPLRGLIAKGLAKDPVVRFPTAGAFLAELEVVAAATYGADWADRGQRALSRAVEALATQLPPAGLAGDATAAGAGSAIAVTVDGGEKAERPHRRVAFGSGRFGLPVVGALILLLAGGVLAAALITHFGSSSTPSGVAGGPRSTASP